MDKQEKALNGFAVGIPTMLSTIDVMVISVILPAIAFSLHTTMFKLQWLLSAYMIVSAATYIALGHVSDRYGYKKLLIIALIFFSIASFLCGFAVNFYFLLIARIMQGAASSAIIIATLTMINAQKNRNILLGKWGFFSGLGVAAGPAIGGLINHYTHWQVIFYLNSLCAFIYLICCYKSIPDSQHTSRNLNIDWLGNAVLLTLMISLITLIEIHFSISGYKGKLLLSVFLISLGLLIFWEIKTNKNTLNIKLFTDKYFLAASIVGFLIYFCMYGWLYLFSYYFQEVVMLNSLITGLLLTPFSIIFLLSSPIVTKYLIKQHNHFLVITISLLIMIASFSGLLVITQQHLYLQVIVCFSLFGLAYAIASPASMSLAMQQMKQKQHGSNTGLLLTLRWLGGAIGVVSVARVMHYTHLKGLSISMYSCGLIIILIIVAILIMSTIYFLGMNGRA